MLRELRCRGTEVLKNGDKKICDKLICRQDIQAGLVEYQCNRCGEKTVFTFKVFSDDKIGLSNETLKNVVRVK